MEAEIRCRWGCNYSLLLSHLQSKVFRDYLSLLGGHRSKRKKYILAALECQVGERKGSAVKDIYLRLIFGEIRGLCFFFFCFVFYYYILYIIKASVRIVTSSKGNFMKMFGFTV